MLPDTVCCDLPERLSEQTDVTGLPIQVGASMRGDDYGALGLGWKAAPTLMNSFHRVERYARLWTSVVEDERRPTGRGTAPRRPPSAGDAAVERCNAGERRVDQPAGLPGRLRAA